MNKEICRCPITASSFAIAMSVTQSVALGVFSLIATHTSHGHDLVNMLGDLLPGYGASLRGTVHGLLWGAFNGFIIGSVLARIYNRLESRATVQACTKNACHS